MCNNKEVNNYTTRLLGRAAPKKPPSWRKKVLTLGFFGSHSLFSKPTPSYNLPHRIKESAVEVEVSRARAAAAVALVVFPGEGT